MYPCRHNQIPADRHDKCLPGGEKYEKKRKRCSGVFIHKVEFLRTKYFVCVFVSVMEATLAEFYFETLRVIMKKWVIIMRNIL